MSFMSTQAIDPAPGCLGCFPRTPVVFGTLPARSIPRSRNRAEPAPPAGYRPGCNRRSSPLRVERQGSMAVRATGSRMRGKKNPTRRPVKSRLSISQCIQLHQGLPWRQYTVSSNKARRHGEQEARPDQARRRRGRNIEKPASGTDGQAKNESDDGSSHNTALLRTPSNRNRNPTNAADAKCANAIG